MLPDRYYLKRSISQAKCFFWKNGRHFRPFKMINFAKPIKTSTNTTILCARFPRRSSTTDFTGKITFFWKTHLWLLKGWNRFFLNVVLAAKSTVQDCIGKRAHNILVLVLVLMGFSKFVPLKDRRWRLFFLKMSFWPWDIEFHLLRIMS